MRRDKLAQLVPMSHRARLAYATHLLRFCFTLLGMRKPTVHIDQIVQPFILLQQTIETLIYNGKFDQFV